MVISSFCVPSCSIVVRIVLISRGSFVNLRIIIVGSMVDILLVSGLCRKELRSKVGTLYIGSLRRVYEAV